MSAVKTIGSSGQIALGKEYAGRTVVVDEVDPGVWVIKLGQFVPDGERWLHTPEARGRLDRGIAWAESHPPSETDVAKLARRLKRSR